MIENPKDFGSANLLPSSFSDCWILTGTMSTEDVQVLCAQSICVSVWIAWREKRKISQVLNMWRIALLPLNFVDFCMFCHIYRNRIPSTHLHLTSLDQNGSSNDWRDNLCRQIACHTHCTGTAWRRSVENCPNIEFILWFPISFAHSRAQCAYALAAF